MIEKWHGGGALPQAEAKKVIFDFFGGNQIKQGQVKIF
jgi:hypothetical protein